MQTPLPLWTFIVLLSPKPYHICPVAIYPRTIWIPPLCNSLVWMLPIPFQGVDRAPSYTLLRGNLLPAAIQYPPTWKFWALRSGTFPEGWRSEPQALRVTPSRTVSSKWRVSCQCIKCYSQMLREANSLRRTGWIVECSLLHWQVRGRALSLARDPNWLLWKPYIT